MKPEECEALTNLFKTEVHDRARDIDEAGTQDWFSLILGWAIAKGLNPADAHTFAIYIRYRTNLA